MRIAIGAIIIDLGALLMVRNKNSWILPGGQIEGDESDEECLLREISEELPEMTAEIVQFYGSFEGKSPNRGDHICVKAYFVQATGNIRPGAEISESRWVTGTFDLPSSEPTIKIVHALQKDGHVLS